jgi:glycosylphosphatidylinositol deacylase
MAEPLRRGHFDGIPVLFIPGNAGSHRQVRSLASVALRKAMDDKMLVHHFDYFAVDFNEEFSALYGGSLEDQAAFVRQSVQAILDLYKADASKPSSVVLIGHSVGGLVAKSLFLDKTFNPKAVHTIITLATPHAAPVINIDPYLNRFYLTIDNFWSINRHLSLAHISLISIGGGYKDIQVRAALTRSQYADLNVQTTAASGVWVSADHRCIVWCKQLTLTLNRALFDLIDSEKGQLSTNKASRDQVFKYHLLQRTAGKRFKTDLHPAKQVFDKDGDWKDILKRQFTFIHEDQLAKNTYLMIKTLDDPKHQMLTVDAVNMDLDNWVFACKASMVHQSNILCEDGINLSSESRIIPSNGKRKSITVNLEQLRLTKGYSHVVVFMAKGMDNLRVSLDVYNADDRLVEATLPKWISFWSETRLIKLTAMDAVFYNISLKELDLPWQAYEVTASELKCQKKRQTHFGLMRLVNSWASDSTHALLGSNMTNRLTAKLPTPKTAAEANNSRSEVLVYLNPDCRYAISIRPHLGEMFGQIVRYYYTMILPAATSIVLMLLVNQLKLLDKEGQVYGCHKILWSQVSPMSAVMPARLLSAVVSTAFLAAFLPDTDLKLLADQGVDFGVLPIMMYFVSTGFVFITTVAALATVVICGSLINKIVVRFFASQIPVSDAPVSEVIADTALSGITKFPVVISVGLLAIGTASCGSVALCLGTFCQFLHLFKMYKDYLEWLVKKSLGLKDPKQLLSQEFGNLNFHLSLGMLWALTAVLNMPSLLAFMHELQSNPRPLAFDHSYPIAVIFSLSLPILWSEDKPDKYKMYYPFVASILQLSSVLIILYGLLAIYR